MTQTTEARDKTHKRPTAPARRFGYLVAIGGNVVMLVIANNILDWGWLGWLTDEFGGVVWLINVAVGVTILLNLAWLAFDPAWYRSAGQIVSNIVSLVVTVRIYQVFPFDFSGYDFDWGALTRVVLILAVVGTAIGTLVEARRLAAATADTSPRAA
ncbi:MAG TPA: hypothetical protein VGC11_13295 [Acidimicrobiia bacterium]